MQVYRNEQLCFIDIGKHTKRFEFLVDFIGRIEPATTNWPVAGRLVRRRTWRSCCFD